MTAHRAGAFRGHDTQLRRRSVAFLYFLTVLSKLTDEPSSRH
jgi:hypothetical protein